MSIQILQYEFLGPIRLEEWGPPMEKLIYLILSSDKDKFDILYVGKCEKTDDELFFTHHPSYNCWTQHMGYEKSLYYWYNDYTRQSQQTNQIITGFNPQNILDFTGTKFFLLEITDYNKNYSRSCSRFLQVLR